MIKCVENVKGENIKKAVSVFLTVEKAIIIEFDLCVCVYCEEHNKHTSLTERTHI